MRSHSTMLSTKLVQLSHLKGPLSKLCLRAIMLSYHEGQLQNECCVRLSALFLITQ